MACSKELRIPKPWLQYHDDIKNEPIDPELFTQEKVFALLKNLGLCNDKSSVEKYVLNVKPYHFVRHQHVNFPNNALKKELYSRWIDAEMALYFCDDVLEQLTPDEMRQICEAYKLLDEHIRDQFPQFPTITEMKAFLLQQNVNEKFIPQIICLHDISNEIGKSLIAHSNYPQKDVKDFWRRLVVIIALYYEGVWDEVKHTTGSFYEMVWPRILQSGCMIWLNPHEVLSGVLVKNDEHLTLLTELYFLNTFVCITVNDIYSHTREMGLLATPCSLLRTIMISEGASEAEAAQKCIGIINAAVKIMYQKIEKTKQENPDNQHLWKVLDDIGVGTAAWYYFHEYSPRYDNSPWGLSVVDVKGSELEEWRKCTDEDPPEEVMPMLLNYSPQAKKISEAILSGVVNMGANLLKD